MRLRKVIATGLALLMMFNTGISSAFASQGAELPANETVICPHHEHNEECGYIEEQPCKHEHTEECYKEITSCTHEHTEECYPTLDNGKKGTEPTECSHECTMESGCVTKELACQHTHDKTCGYSEGSPCNFDSKDCLLCNPSEDTDENTENNVANSTITSFAEFETEISATTVIAKDETEDEIKELGKEKAEELLATFPKTLTAFENDNQDVSVDVAVTWESDEPLTTTEFAGEYTYTAKLNEGFILDEDVELPQITVTVIDTSMMNTLEENGSIKIGTDGDYSTLTALFADSNISGNVSVILVSTVEDIDLIIPDRYTSLDLSAEGESKLILKENAAFYANGKSLTINCPIIDDLGGYGSVQVYAGGKEDVEINTQKLNISVLDKGILYLGSKNADFTGDVEVTLNSNCNITTIYGGGQAIAVDKESSDWKDGLDNVTSNVTGSRTINVMEDATVKTIYGGGIAQKAYKTDSEDKGPYTAVSTQTGDVTINVNGKNDKVFGGGYAASLYEHTNYLTATSNVEGNITINYGANAQSTGRNKMELYGGGYAKTPSEKLEYQDKATANVKGNITINATKDANASKGQPNSRSFGRYFGGGRAEGRSSFAQVDGNISIQTSRVCWESSYGLIGGGFSKWGGNADVSGSVDIDVYPNEGQISSYENVNGLFGGGYVVLNQSYVAETASAKIDGDVTIDVHPGVNLTDGSSIGINVCGGGYLEFFNDYKDADMPFVDIGGDVTIKVNKPNQLTQAIRPRGLWRNEDTYKKGYIWDSVQGNIQSDLILDKSINATGTIWYGGTTVTIPGDKYFAVYANDGEMDVNIQEPIQYANPIIYVQKYPQYSKVNCLNSEYELVNRPQNNWAQLWYIQEKVTKPTEVEITITDNLVEYDGDPKLVTVTTKPELNTDDYKITYKDENGNEVAEPTDVGKYDVCAEITNTKYCHVSGITDNKVGTLVIYQKSESESHTIKGTCPQGNDVTISLVQGSTIIKTADIAGNQYVITDVSNGKYNIVMTKGDLTITDYVEVKDVDVTHDFDIGKGNLNTVVTVETDLPDIVVKDLEKNFTEDDKNSTANIELKLKIEKITDANTEDCNKIQELNEKIGIFLDINLYKTTNGTQEKITELPAMTTLAIPIPENLQGKAEYFVYRTHEGKADTITTAENDNGEYIEILAEEQKIYLHINKLSTYAIGYSEKFTITFDANGGTVTPTTAETKTDGKLTDLPTPTKSGYKFNGWFTETTGGTKITTDTVFKTDKTVYAQWTKKSSGSTGGGSHYDYYTITASASVGGVISDNGSTRVREYSSKEYTITPTKGYIIDDVKVDGKSVGAVSSYKFTNVRENHKIEAAFRTSTEHANPQTGVDFEDITEKDWFYDSVINAVENGWFTGTSHTTFSPNLSTTRGMIATVLWRMENSPISNFAMSFEDVADSGYYYDAVKWSQENGIVKGYSDVKYAPNDTITREQMVAILYRYANYKGYDVSIGEETNILSYNDAPSISEYAIPAMQWAVGAEIIFGKGNGTLDPKGFATRAEVATILSRFNQAVAK